MSANISKQAFIQALNVKNIHYSVPNEQPNKTFLNDQVLPQNVTVPFFSHDTSG